MAPDSTPLWIECAEDGTVLRGSDEALALLASLRPALSSLAPYIARRPDLEAAFRRREGVVRLGLRHASGPIACSVEIGEGSRGGLHLSLALSPLSREPALADSLLDWALAARDGIALCDPDGHLLFANPALCELAGLSAEDLHGRDLFALAASASRGADDEELRRSLFVSGSWRGDRLLHRAEGGTTLVELGLTAFGGPPTSQILALFRDVGDLRESEALALAEAMSGTSARLAAGISHDVNNLAAEIVAWAEEAIASGDPEDLREALSHEVSLGLAAGEVGQQLQRLSGEAGGEEPVDVGVVLKDLAWLIERAATHVREVQALPPAEPVFMLTSGAVLRSLLLVLAMRLLGEGDSPVQLWSSRTGDRVHIHVRCAASFDERERLKRLFPSHRLVSPLGNALSVRAMRVGLAASMKVEHDEVTFTLSGQVVLREQPALVG